MARKATICKASLQIADMDRDYYQAHAITLARHPSETDERMMVRLLAFARHASETLAFSRGLSTVEEPDLWQHGPAGDIELWIDLGQPDEKRIRRACSQARQVCIYCYSGHSAGIWWERIRGRLGKLHNLNVINLPPPASDALAGLAQRSMQLQCTIQDRQIWLGDADTLVEINPEIWM